MNIELILNTLRTECATNLPGLLAAGALADLGRYIVGGSRNATDLGLFIYQDEVMLAPDTESISIICLAQLYKITDGVEKYSDIIKDFLLSIDSNILGMDLMQSLNVDTWRIEKHSTTEMYFTITYSKEKDSCD